MNAPKRLPQRLKAAGRAYLPQPRRRSIALDVVSATHVNHFELRFFCDDCAHYAASEISPRRRCTLGYPARHTRAEQLALYNLTGRMALCRAIEID